MNGSPLTFNWCTRNCDDCFGHCSSYTGASPCQIVSVISNPSRVVFVLHLSAISSRRSMYISSGFRVVNLLCVDLYSCRCIFLKFGVSSKSVNWMYPSGGSVVCVKMFSLLGFPSPEVLSFVINCFSLHRKLGILFLLRWGYF